MGLAPNPASLDQDRMASQVARLKIGDESWEFRPADLSGDQDLVLYRATGMTGHELLGMLMAGRVALFALAGFIWVARHQAGDKVTIDEVLADTKYTAITELELELVEDEEGETSPPA